MSRHRETQAVLFILAIVGVVAIGYGPYWRLAPGVTPAAIRAIRIGMSPEEVTALLGPPLQIRAWGAGTILDYARPHPLAPWSSRLWVYFEDGRVDTVQGERISLVGDKRGVYLLGPDRAEWAAEDFQATFRPWWRSGQ